MEPLSSSPSPFPFSSDPSSSYHSVAVVEDRSLARGDRRLGVIELDPNSACSDWSYRRRSFDRPIAYAYTRAHRHVRLRDRQPVHTRRGQRLSVQLTLASNYELVPRHIDLDNVKRLARGD